MSSNLKSRMIFAFSLGFFYWLSDSIKVSIVTGSSFTSAFIGSEAESGFFLRVVIVALIILVAVILSLIFLPTKDENEIVSSSSNHVGSTFFNNINRTLISTAFSIENRLTKSAELIEQKYGFASVIISLEKEGNLEIVNYNEKIAKYMGNKKIYTIQNSNSDELTLVAKIIGNQFLKQVGYSIRKIEPPIPTLGIWGVVNIGLISKNSSKIIGMLSILIKTRNNLSTDLEETLKVLAGDISFFISFDRQKTVLLQEFERNEKDLEFSHDLTLHIAKHSVVNSILSLETKRAARYSARLSLLIFEIDNLFNIQNAFSEEIALQAKKDLVSSVQKNIRELDTLGVWNGDQFMVIAPETDGDGAYRFAEKLVSDIASTRFKEVNKITCSFGIAWFTKSSGDGELELVKRCEAALLSAKEMGGNKIVFM